VAAASMAAQYQQLKILKALGESNAKKMASAWRKRENCGENFNGHQR
jgi:hypothetical protein